MDYLLLLTGVDIPFPEGRLVIHAPKIKDIGVLEETNFWLVCQFLISPKELITFKDKTVLDTTTDFQIIMSVMNSDFQETSSLKEKTEFLLTMLFPNCSIKYNKESINIACDSFEGFIDANNYPSLQKILGRVFGLYNVIEQKVEDNTPKGKKFMEIEKKFEERRKKLAELKKDNDKQTLSIISRYISIMSIGLEQPINFFVDCTVFQLFDMFQRFALKIQYDYYYQAKLAGAKDMEDVDDWMNDFYEQTS